MKGHHRENSDMITRDQVISKVEEFYDQISEIHMFPVCL